MIFNIFYFYVIIKFNFFNSMILKKLNFIMTYTNVLSILNFNPELMVNYMSDDGDEMTDIFPNDITNISGNAAAEVIEKTDEKYAEFCILEKEIIQILDPYLNGTKCKKIYIIDALNETCRVRVQEMKSFRDPHVSHGPQQCAIPECRCYFEHIFTDQSKRYSDSILLVVTKDPNFKEKENWWYESVNELSELPNVIMFPMTMDDTMEIDFDTRPEWNNWCILQKKEKIREHDDLAVRLLKRILYKRYGSRCEVVTQDRYRDAKIVAKVNPPYTFNIVNNSNILLQKKIIPNVVNSFAPCKCNNWHCSQKVAVLSN